MMYEIPVRLRMWSDAPTTANNIQTRLRWSIVWAVVWVCRWEASGAGSTIRGEKENLKHVADCGRENTMTTTLTPDTKELREIASLPTESALPRAARFLADLVKDMGFVEARILPLVGAAEDGRDWYVARQYDGEDGSYSLKVFVWPAGTGTKIHDHSSWGAYACAFGAVLEERYERLDDGSVAEHARLEKAWGLLWSPQDGASTVLPGNGGIHRVGNPNEGTAVSVHLYGPRMGEVDGRDFDPSRDYLCDRPA
jgi:predicted metal-dependent enzyme (double-stranded beta helix superfamily)